MNLKKKLQQIKETIKKEYIPKNREEKPNNKSKEVLAKYHTTLYSTDGKDKDE